MLIVKYLSFYMYYSRSLILKNTNNHQDRFKFSYWFYSIELTLQNKFLKNVFQNFLGVLEIQMSADCYIIEMYDR